MNSSNIPMDVAFAAPNFDLKIFFGAVLFW
jgi:hypothetical protein